MKFETCYKVEKSIILTSMVKKKWNMLLRVKFSLLWPSFGLKFYTTLNLASLGTAWYKILDLILAKEDGWILPSENRFHFFLTMEVRKIQFFQLGIVKWKKILWDTCVYICQLDVQKMSKETAKNILACKIRFYTLIRGLLELFSFNGGILFPPLHYFFTRKCWHV